MKVLFVDQSAELQQKWVNPLRLEGWGVLRARSPEEAERMMLFHGSSIGAVVLEEKVADFGEKIAVPFMILIRTWNEAQIVKHQNGKRSALYYLPFSASVKEFCSAFQARPGAISLEIVRSEVGVKSEPIKNEIQHEIKESTESSILLEASPVYLGGIEAVESKKTNEGQTVILESTRSSNLALKLEPVDLVENVAEIENIFQETREEGRIEARSEARSEVRAVEFHEPKASAASADLETLRSYLSLREQDVALLTGQARSYQERAQQLEARLRVEQSRATELQHLVQRHEQTIKHFERDKAVDFEVLTKTVSDLNSQLQERTEKTRLIEAKLKIASDEVAQIKERVKIDIRRIRVREKELENQLEILKKDSSALLLARDEKILELKRKLDLAEFNMELLQEQYKKESQSTESLRNRLKDAAQAMRQAGGLLENEN